MAYRSHTQPPRTKNVKRSYAKASSSIIVFCFLEPQLAQSDLHLIKVQLRSNFYGCLFVLFPSPRTHTTSLRAGAILRWGYPLSHIIKTRKRMCRKGGAGIPLRLLHFAS